VIEGTVVIQLLRNHSLVIPAGGAWPGLEHLPAHLVAHLKPVAAMNVPGARTVPSGEEDRSAAVALITAQALSAVGSVSDRFAFAERMGIPFRKMNQSTGARVINTARETFTKFLNL